MELVLPKQVCRELLYGYAEKPVHQHTPPPLVRHSSKIKYGPKIGKTPRKVESINEEKKVIPEEIMNKELSL